MGNCISTYRGKKTKKGKGKEFDEIENPRKRETKKNTQSKDSDDSDSSSGSSSDARRAKVRKSKNVSRQENGGLVVVSKKTVVGDIIKVKGSKSVNIKTGGRRRRENGQRDKRQDSGRQNERPAFFFPKVRSIHQSTNPMPGCFLQISDRRVLVLDQRHLLEVAKSVGKVCAGDYCGTCFRVGHNYVMTARHVVMDIVNNGIISLGARRPTTFAALDNENVFVNFDFLSRNTATIRKFHLSSNVVFEDDVLDIAVVELKAGAHEFPPPFCNFAQAQPNIKFKFVGHPFGEPKQLNEVDGLLAVSPETKEEAVTWSRQVAGLDGFAGMEIPGRVLFHCSFQKGGSGSPGIAVVEGQAVVVTVLLHGYPDWFYDPNFDQDIKNRVANQQRIEQGVSMMDLYLKMHAVNRDLCYAIFDRANE